MEEQDSFPVVGIVILAVHFKLFRLYGILNSLGLPPF